MNKLLLLRLNRVLGDNRCATIANYRRVSGKSALVSLKSTGLMCLIAGLMRVAKVLSVFAQYLNC